MVYKRQIARRIEKKLRAEECSEIAVAAINRNITISINGTLNQKTIIRSLVGMSANKLSVHSINKVVEKIPCETSVRYHLSNFRKSNRKSSRILKIRSLSRENRTILP